MALATDPYWSNVQLLLDCEGADGSAVFTDRSNYARVVTANGNAQLDTSVPLYGTAAGLLDGTGDYLSLTANTLGNGAWTLEGQFRWAALPSVGGYSTLFSLAATTASGLLLWMQNAAGVRKLSLYLSSNGTSWNVASATLGAKTDWAADTTYAIAAEFDGAVYRVIVDGVVDIAAASTERVAAQTSWRLGRHTDTYPGGFAGRFDEVRFTKGIARYGGAYTPQTEPFPLAGDPPDAGVAPDPHWGDVVLLLPCDGADGSIEFPDESNSGHAISVNGNVQVDTAVSAFGDASALFDGTGDYLSAADSADWAFGSGDFTIEFDVWFNAVPGAGAYAVFVSQRAASNSNNAFSCWYGGTEKFYLSYSTDGVTQKTLSSITSYTPLVGRRYHLAWVRQGTAFNLFIEGDQQTPKSIGTDALYNATAPLRIGATNTTPAYFLNGWLDNIRITRAARYTAAFMPPFAPHPLRGAALLSATSADDIAELLGTAITPRVLAPKNLTDVALLTPATELAVPATVLTRIGGFPPVVGSTLVYP